MDIIVYLALIVLAAVFLFSLFILVVMCRRRYEYNRLLFSQTLRFSKLKQDNLDDVIQLAPHISQMLSRNQWVEELTTGLLQHCVSVLKLCHTLTEQMAQTPLDQQYLPEHNELICKATSRIMPRFEALLQAMAAKEVDIRVVEARICALVSCCWALVAPFCVANSSRKDQLDDIIIQMERHSAALQLALDQFEAEQQQLMDPSKVGTSAQLNRQLQNNSRAQRQTQTQIANPVSIAFDKRNKHLDANGQLTTGTALRVNRKDEASTSLLKDETPADPAIT